MRILNPLGEIATLGEMLDLLEAAAVAEKRISVRLALEAVGPRAYGPLFLIPGLIAFSPLSGIPGVPTLTATMVGLLAVQILLGRREMWLPDWILERSLDRARFLRTLAWLRPGARRADRVFRPRLSWLTRGAGLRGIAAVCLLMALAAPLMELLPFAISVVGFAVSTFGMAILFHDGLLALAAFATCIGIAAVGVALIA